MSEVLVIAITAFMALFLAGFAAIRAGDTFMQRYRESFLEQARLNLSDMFLFVDPRVLFVTNMVSLLVLPLVVWAATGSALVAVIVAIVVALLPRKLYAWMKQRRLDRIQAQLPDALMMMSGTMKAGLGFTPALESIVHDGYPPLAQELALVLREQHMGVRTEEALENFAKRVPIQDATLFVSAVGISRDVGGNLAETLATLAETLRRRLIMEGKVKALTSQGRLQGIVMAMLPMGIVGYLALAYPDTMAPMFSTWVGYTVIAICLVLEYVGYRICRKIMSIDV